MLTLQTPHVLAALASNAGVINATAALDSITSGADSFDGSTPASIGVTATSIISPSAGVQALVKSLHFFNTSGAQQTLKVFYPTNANQIYQAIIPALGTVIWTPDDGWKIYDSAGLEQKLNLKTDTFAVGTSPGPFPLSFTPDGRLVIPTLGATVVPAADYTLSGASITFTNDAATAIAAGAFSTGSTSYSY